MELIPSPIKLAALERGLPVLQPEDVNANEAIEHLRSLAPDVLVTAAYGQILSAELLGIAKHGGINLHGSILPSYRGASPVARAIQDGLSETGVTVIRMTPRIDAGGMMAVGKTAIDPDETAGELEDRLAALGAPLILDSLASIESGSVTILPQAKTRVTKAPKLRKEEGQIDWSKSAKSIHDHVRAMQPWPIASTLWHSSQPGKPPQRIIVHKTQITEGKGLAGTVIEVDKSKIVVAAGQGAISLVTVQVPGKKPMTAAEFLRGHRVNLGDRMGEST